MTDDIERLVRLGQSFGCAGKSSGPAVATGACSSAPTTPRAPRWSMRWSRAAFRRCRWRSKRVCAESRSELLPGEVVHVTTVETALQFITVS